MRGQNITDYPEIYYGKQERSIRVREVASSKTLLPLNLGPPYDAVERGKSAAGDEDQDRQREIKLAASRFPRPR